MNRAIPNKLKVLRGNQGKRPIRPEPEPPAGIPDCPDYVAMIPDALATWNYYLPILAGMGCFSVADIAILASLCLVHADLLFHMREIQRMNGESENGLGGVVITTGTGYMAPNPLYSNLQKCIDREVKLCGELGLSPVSRARLHPAEKKEERTDDPWGKL